MANHSEVRNFFSKVHSRRGVKGVVDAGDLKFPELDWDSFSSHVAIDQLFLDSFSNFELEQLFQVPSPYSHKSKYFRSLIILTIRPQLVFDTACL